MKGKRSKEVVFPLLPFFLLFHTSKNGLSHTAFGVQGAPQMGLLLKPYFKTDGEHSARIVEGEFSC